MSLKNLISQALINQMDSDIIAQLRLTEGTLFKNESVKRFFIDTKSLVFSLLTEYMNPKELYVSKVQELLVWSNELQQEILERCEAIFPDMLTRLTPTCVTYAKSLYNKPGQDVNLQLKEPKITTYLKSIFTRIGSTPSVISGTFYELDPINQDFVLRDIFRQALATDCIDLKEEEYPSTIEEVYPCDSVSQVFFDYKPAQEADAKSETKSVLKLPTRLDEPAKATETKSEVRFAENRTEVRFSDDRTEIRVVEEKEKTNFQLLEEAVKHIDTKSVKDESSVTSVNKLPLVRRIELSGED